MNQIVGLSVFPSPRTIDSAGAMIEEKVVIALNVCLNPLGRFQSAAPAKLQHVGVMQGLPIWGQK